MSLLPCLVESKPGQPLFALFGSGGGGGGSSNIYPIVSTLGIDPSFSTSGTLVMNVSTTGTSQTLNVSQQFTVYNGHAYTIAWKPNWEIGDGAANSGFASLQCSIGGSANLAGKFYSPCFGQKDAEASQVELVGTFRCDVPGSTIAQLVVTTVDYPLTAPTSTQFSSVITALTGKDVYPVLIDYGVQQ